MLLFGQVLKETLCMSSNTWIGVCPKLVQTKMSSLFIKEMKSSRNTVDRTHLYSFSSYIVYAQYYLYASSVGA